MQTNPKFFNPKYTPPTDSELKQKEISKRLAVLNLCNEKMTLAENQEAENLINSRGQVFLGRLNEHGKSELFQFQDLDLFKSFNQQNPYVPISHPKPSKTLPSECWES